MGEKTAQRFTLHLVTDGGELAAELGQELLKLRETVAPCSQCGHMADLVEQGRPLCSICRDPHRDPGVVCVVAKVQDLLALERSSAIRGYYFVLGRLLSPLDGVGPDRLPLDALKRRVIDPIVKEIILATPPSVEGEATALFLAQELARPGLQISRIASGVPHGGDLEFADQITLGRAVVGRRRVGDGG